ncbi:hypothetical protein [Kitasatospora sp. NPDC059827]|uniref:hypothetical protein n=1 Tax=Kitasatospora sp. NPDC059827 TaxID=3346964 RepID=UPI0036697EDF
MTVHQSESPREASVTIMHEEVRGHLLLLATAANLRNHHFDSELGVAAMAAVPPAALLPDCPGAIDVVQIINPGEPQSVLARIHTAAVTTGPLLIYLCGQIVRERKHRQIHLLLSKTTERRMRSTALPWQWLDLELARRAPGTTRVIVDLIADPSCGSLQPTDLQLPAHVIRWGSVTQPRGRSSWTVPAYTKALTRLMSARQAKSVAQAHDEAVAEAALDEGSVIFCDTRPPRRTTAPRTSTDPDDRPAAGPAPGSAAPAPETDLRSALVRAMHNGNLVEAGRIAATWEHQVLRDHGSHSIHMGDVMEAQATLETRSGNLAHATHLWISTAKNRAVWCQPDSEPLQLALRNAQANWFRLDMSWPQCHQLGTELVDLLYKAGQPQAIPAVENRLLGAPLGRPVRPNSGTRSSA